MEQTTSRLLLIRPACFSYNPETAFSNSFQEINTTPVDKLASREFEYFNANLLKENIETIVFEDLKSIGSPDAVFPNNWLSLHHDGSLFLYPMEAAVRRRERRKEIPELLQEKYNFRVNNIHDLSAYEKENKFLEGTGSIVFDHIHRVAYMALSSRSHPEPFEKLLSITGYRGYTFHTSGPDKKPVYHTNVLLSVGMHFATVCFDCIPDATEKEKLRELLEQTGKTIIEISMQQMASYAGNMLEVKNSDNDPFLLLSMQALSSLKSNQRKTLEQSVTLLPSDISTIEKHGGGSIRCMVAEIFLPMDSSDKIKISEPGTHADFERYYDLRYRVLREPWNQPRGTEKDDGEDASLHFMAIGNHNKLAGVSRLQFNSDKVAQVRYMAVDESYRGKGIGKMLMRVMEERAIKTGRTEIFLQAREVAVPFYESLGYSVIEKTFLLFGAIQHYSMNKKLS